MAVTERTSLGSIFNPHSQDSDKPKGMPTILYEAAGTKGHQVEAKTSFAARDALQGLVKDTRAVLGSIHPSTYSFVHPLPLKL